MPFSTARKLPFLPAAPPVDHATIHALRALEAFRDLPQQRLSKLSAMAPLRRVLRGDVLFRRGEPSDSLFLIVSGRFFVSLDSNDYPVAEIGIGEPIGEIAFLTGQPRTATVVAARDSQVLEIQRAYYDALVECAPRLQQILLTRLADRMSRMAPAARPLGRAPARTIGLVAVGSAPLPEALVQTLAAQLQASGATEVVPVDILSRGREATEVHFRRLEQQCRFVLCPIGFGEGDAGQALAHCDAVILVGHLKDAGQGGVPRSFIEGEATRLFPKGNRSLVLWRECADEPIVGSAGWLEGRAVDLHHHVALDRHEDFERLARFMSGRAIGAVFGGGGALGCGHIGVARAFRDAGISFDLYGGTSAGAAMAFALAAGKSPEEVMDRSEEIFVRRRALGRYTLPVFSFLDHTVFDSELAANYGDLDIRDLPVNGYAVSTSLTQNELKVHRAGLVWHAVRSSGAIPGALPPFIDADGDVLVDGALLDNLPVRTMRALKLGPNVLSGFFADEGKRYQSSYGNIPGRLGLLGDMMLRRRRRFPRLLSVIERSMLVTSRRSFQDVELAGDLLLRLPSPPGMRLLDWHKGRAQEEAAYRFVSVLIDKAGGAQALIERPQPAEGC